MNVKICGLVDEACLAAAVDAGARYVGFVFFPKSPRHVTVERARALAVHVPPEVCKVALTVDPSDADLDKIVNHAPIDMLQLHGSESPARVAEIKSRFGLPVMKAIGIGQSEDLEQIAEYAPVVDQILVDAKPPKGSDVPGGNGVTFDWNLLAGRRWAVPWMLSGGLTQDNVVDAIKHTGAQQIDLSSGVEVSRGVKDPTLIREFMAKLA